MAIGEELERLGRLVDEGKLTKSEFEQAKAKLLGDNATSAQSFSPPESQAINVGVDLPAGPFVVVMKKPISMPQRSEVMFAADRFMFGEKGRDGTVWKLELPYSEIDTFDSSRGVTGIVTGTLKDGRPLEFRLKSTGPTKELSKMLGLAAVSAQIGALSEGSLKPIPKSDPVLIMRAEPPPGFTPSSLADVLELADEEGVGDRARRFVSITEEAGFFVSGTHTRALQAEVGDLQGTLYMQWKRSGAIRLGHSFRGPIREKSDELLGKQTLVIRVVDPKDVDKNLDSIELFTKLYCRREDP